MGCAQPVLKIALTDEERNTLTAIGAGKHRKVERARVILLASQGLSAERPLAG
jgi:hypothetical protein